MTSFSMTSLHVDPKEAENCVDILYYIASLIIAPSHTSTKYKMATIFEVSLTNL